MHYCTYFDRNFLIQGLALFRSLVAQAPDATLWVLALDEETRFALDDLSDARLRVVALADLEAADPDLLAARGTRSRVEYFFTLSPCWPRWLLQAHPEIARVTYVDADMAFFASPDPIFAAMEQAGASILITAHRFPEPIRRHYEQHGRYNVGILVFSRDQAGLACLEEWRAACLAWCFDRLEDGKYADQKYLDAWPQRFGASLLVLEHPGVNLAPWNWRSSPVEVSSSGEVRVRSLPLILFHFARFRPLAGDWLWQSGQLDYGVMPIGLRRAIYGPYWRWLEAARRELRAVHPGFDFSRRALRLNRGTLQSLPLRLGFGSDWLRVGSSFCSLGFGLGRSSGYFLAWVRKNLLRR